MKKLLTIIAVLFIGLLMVIVLIPKSQPAPAFSLTDLNGQTIDNNNLKGKVTFINFWFPSCPGCVSEMPKVIKMAHDYQGKNFQVLGISQPFDPLENVRNYANTRQLPFTVMYDAHGTVGKAFGTQVYPTSVLINKQGDIVKTFVGEPHFPDLYREIDAELAK